MGKAVKKEPIVSALQQYQDRFRSVVDAASAFENHDTQGQKLLYAALEQVFEFGEEIRQDAPAFESFLEVHGKTLNKVTKDNPYNALIELAFAGNRSKSWRSEISNVLRLASDINVKESLSQWLEAGGGISGRYEEAVDHFARPATTKAQKLRSSRLDMITAELKHSRIVTTALPGVTLANGFHRSLLFPKAVRPSSSMFAMKTIKKSSTSICSKSPATGNPTSIRLPTGRSIRCTGQSTLLPAPACRPTTAKSS